MGERGCFLRLGAYVRRGQQVLGAQDVRRGTEEGGGREGVKDVFLDFWCMP